jgi:acetyl-CoA carboxylase biotin carboxyl carrier protein
MELPEIRKLVRLMQHAGLSELEIDDKNLGVRVHLKRELGKSGAETALGPVVQLVPPVSAGAVPTPAAAPAAGPAGALPPGTEVFASPIVGTFYRAPAPDAEPFVVVGTQIDEGSVLCIIEAMKVMNEIKAETRGEIVEILVESGEPVEFGQPLFLIKKG